MPDENSNFDLNFIKWIQTSRLHDKNKITFIFNTGNTLSTEFKNSIKQLLDVSFLKQNQGRT